MIGTRVSSLGRNDSGYCDEDDKSSAYLSPPPSQLTGTEGIAHDPSPSATTKARKTVAQFLLEHRAKKEERERSRIDATASITAGIASVAVVGGQTSHHDTSSPRPDSPVHAPNDTFVFGAAIVAPTTAVSGETAVPSSLPVTCSGFDNPERAGSGNFVIGASGSSSRRGPSIVKRKALVKKIPSSPIDASTASDRPILAVRPRLKTPNLSAIVPIVGANEAEKAGSTSIVVEDGGERAVEGRRSAGGSEGDALKPGVDVLKKNATEASILGAGSNAVSSFDGFLEFDG